MFLTVTPNPCIERTVTLDGFQPGQVHRVPPAMLRVNAGGKGINAARVAARLGCETLAIGWVGRRQAAWFQAQLESEGVPYDLVEVEPDTRITINILKAEGGGFQKTEIVEAGNPLGITDGTRLLEKFAALLPRASLVAICGSYPPTPDGSSLGSSPDATFDAHLTLLTHLARRSGVRVIVDGKGRPFGMVVRSKQPPWCIKPNLDEAAELLHRPIVGEAAERRAIRDMLGFGVEVILLSCGARGAYLGTAGGTWFLPAPVVREVSPVGSGDALVGAFAARFLETQDLLEAARWGVAAGAANASQLMPAFCQRANVEALLPEVQARPHILMLDVDGSAQPQSL